MNKNQRYYAILALTQNQDFIEAIKALRRAQSFLDQSIPEDGFESPEDADAFIKAQNQAVQEKKIDVDEHPLWKLEQDLIALMARYGLQEDDDKHLFEIGKHYFYLNEVMLSRDRFRMTFDRKNKEVSLVMKQDTTKSDVRDNLDMIFDYKDKLLGKSPRKSEIFYFDEKLEFYKLYLRLKKQHPNHTDYKIIQLIFSLYDKGKADGNGDNIFIAAKDQRQAYEAIRYFQQSFSDLDLLSSLEKNTPI